MEKSDFIEWICKTFPRLVRDSAREIVQKRIDDFDLPYFSYINKSPKINEIKVAGERLLFFERVHFKVKISEDEFLNLEGLILACLATRSTDGFLRELALNRVIRANENWTIPFVLALLGDYVIEILYVLERDFDLIDPTILLNYVTENLNHYDLVRSQMESYWDCNYRRIFSKHEFVGFRIFQKIEALMR